METGFLLKRQITIYSLESSSKTTAKYQRTQYAVILRSDKYDSIDINKNYMGHKFA